VKKALLVFLLIAVLFLSGCTEQRPVNVDANNGLLITMFSVEPLKIDKGDNVVVMMDIENVGGVPATDIEANFYGAEGWEGTSNKTIADLDPPDPVMGTPGDFKTVTVTLTSPDDLPQGVQVNYPITARVTYSYKTTAAITIPAYSEDLYKVNVQQGRAMETEAKVENTNAPIKVDLTRGPTPIVVGTKGEETSYVLEFKNVGSGWPSESTTEEIGRMTGKIKVYGATLIECLDKNANSDNSVTLDMSVFKMRGATASVPVSCSVSLPSGWTSTQSGSIIFTVDIDYDYYIEKTANVMVWGGTE
jgi:hypothetical protein